MAEVPGLWVQENPGRQRGREEAEGHHDGLKYKQVSFIHNT